MARTAGRHPGSSKGCPNGKRCPTCSARPTRRLLLDTLTGVAVLALMIGLLALEQPPPDEPVLSEAMENMIRQWSEEQAEVLTEMLLQQADAEAESDP